MRTIRKNKNRRFFDLSMSRHVKMDELLRFIKEEDGIMVTKEDSGEDLTNHTLKQLIQYVNIPDLILIELLKKYPLVPKLEE